MSTLVTEVQNRGYQYFDWNISSGDAGETTDPSVEANNVIKNLSRKCGNIILMHDIKKAYRASNRNDRKIRCRKWIQV